MSLQPSFEYSGPEAAPPVQIPRPRPRSARSDHRQRPNAQRGNDAQPEQEDEDEGVWHRGDEEEDRDCEEHWHVQSDYVAVDENEVADGEGIRQMERMENWNARIAKLFVGGAGERTQFAEDTSDVVFKLVEQDGQSEEEVLFRGHKFVLSLRSPVFRAMFYGPLAEKAACVSVPDVTPTAFKAMLSYIYKDTVRVQTLQGAWQLWYAARKYMIDSLEEKCRKVRIAHYEFLYTYIFYSTLQHLKTHLSPWNVLDTYAFAENYGDVQVLYQCLRLIDRNAGYVLASPGFSILPIRLVKSIASRRTLNAKEVRF